MKLLCVHRISCASLIVMGTLALGSTSFAPRAAAQSASPTPQGEPQRPGEERRREQRGAQPQSQPQRPGNQSSQPQAPRHEQRQQTEQERRPGSQGQQGTAQPSERRQPPGTPQQGQPRTTQQPPQLPRREQTQEERRLPPGAQPGRPGQPRTTQQPGQPQGTPGRREETQEHRPVPGPGMQQPGAAPRTTQPGQAPGTPGATQPRTTQQPGQAPGTPGATQPRTTQQPAQPPGAPSQATQQPTTQMPGTDRQDLHRPPTSGAPAPSANTQPVQPQQGRPAQPAAPGVATADPRQQQQQFESMRQHRQERVENNGQRTVIVEPDRRTIVRENGRVFIRHDEVERFRLISRDVRVERRGTETVTLVRRPGNVEIVTYLDDDGRLLRRVRRSPDGREFVLIDNRVRGPEIFISLPPPRIMIPRDQYVVEIAHAPRERIFLALAAPPVERIERPYTLDEIRFSPALRDRMPRVDLDTINFEFGSWQVAPDQVALLADIAEGINEAVRRNPNEVFLIEGHTDAVGNDVDNLSLSDRRAESVAVILTENFQVPPENLTTQGYGAQQLKVETSGPSRENRRVTVRRITPLLTGSSQ